MPRHAPEERHQPHIRRKRKRRVRKRLFWRRYGAFGVLGVALLAVAAFVGGLWLTALLLRSASTSSQMEDVGAMEALVLQTCRESMDKVDCECFWDRSQDAYTDATVAPMMQALTERDRWGPLITRGRLERVGGSEASSLIGRALYDCYRQ